jgi:hypothetical protein
LLVPDNPLFSDRLLVVLKLPELFLLSLFSIVFVGMLLFLLLGTVWGASTPGRLSKRGQAYLARLQLVYRRGVPAEGFSLASTAGDAKPSLLVAFALFGIEGVTGSRYEFLEKMFTLPSQSY